MNYSLLQDLLTAASVRHFKASEFGKLRRKSWTGPREMLPDDLHKMIPCAVIWDLIRDELGAPITLTSTYRPKEYNTQKGQSDTSLHIHGAAADGVWAGEYMVLFRCVERVVNRPETREKIAARCGLDVDEIRIGWGSYPEPHNGFIHVDVTCTSWDIWSAKRSKKVTRFK